MKLAGKLIVVFILTVVGITAIASHITTRRTFEQFQSQQQELAKALSRRIQLDVARAYQNGNMVRVTQLVAQFKNDQTQVRWVWFERSVVAEMRPHVNSELLTRVRGVASLPRRTGDGQRHLHTYYPIDVGDDRRGGLELTTSLDWIDKRTLEIWLTSLLSIGAIGLIGIAFVMVAGVRWVARPLEALTEKMRRVGQGDFSGDLNLTGNDELSQLAGAVNRMCHQLEDQQVTIKQESQKKIEALQQLRHADRLKTVGQLAAGVAHEVGTPLSVVSGRAGMISSSELTPDQMRSFAKDIKTEADRITVIVRQLLDFARQGDSQKQQHDLRDVVEQSVSLLDALAARRNINLVAQLPDEPLEALFDFSQIQQVITNVIDNALDTSKEGQEVRLRLSERGDQLSADGTKRYGVITIEDQGAGISPQDQANIFEPFFTTKDVGAGTGLGLSIALGIVEDHGGKIEVKSQLAHGTQVEIWIPLTT